MRFEFIPVDEDAISKAIRYIEFSRSTHVDCIDFIRESPEEARKPEPWIEAAGDIDHHQRCIDQYDFVINVLMQLRDQLRSGITQ